MYPLSRRRFLAATAATAATGIVTTLHPLLRPSPALATGATTIRVDTRTIDVNGRAATVFGLTQADGSPGLVTTAGERFRVRLENGLDEETLIHWHGLTPPWQQDGVPDLSQPPLAVGEAYDYDFRLTKPGTNWMHSHHGLQEQQLMAAPLIVRDPTEAGEDIQEVVVLFHDFTFRDPNEILAGLQGAAMPMDGMDHAAMGHGAMPMDAGPHLHDVDYDAFLANDRTLADPEVVRVERGGRVRLRLINGATATHFWLDLGALEGRLVAVDGNAIVPVVGKRFEFAIAQRLDILLDLPAADGAWPVLAMREGDTKRTGIVLATSGGSVAKVGPEADSATPAVGLGLERRLRAATPLAPRAPDRQLTLTITEAPGYVWMLNGAVHGEHRPLEVAAGERVEVTMIDQTTMSHPMHLHGHHFQVVAIDGERFDGAMRDTVLVPSGGRVTIAFDADNPGHWAFHCHHLYHMAGGMMTTVEYEGVT
jgi:FtsP/CotA-like multicopper oxidase with cupredoxin domain